MRKIVYLFFSLTSLFIISGCGYDEQPVKSLGQAFANDQELNPYIEDVTLSLFDENLSNKVKYYNIVLTGNSEFNSLSEDEKADLLKHMNDIVAERNEEYFNEGSKRIKCDPNYKCEVLNLSFVDDDVTYSQPYRTEGEESVSYFRDDEEVFLVEEKEEEIEVASTEEESEPVEDEPLDITEDNEETYSYVDTNYSTATGVDWVQYTYDQKYTMVSEVIFNFESSGEYTINVEPEWFIDSLDAFYGDGTTADDQTIASEKVSDVMLLSGMAGNVFE